MNLDIDAGNRVDRLLSHDIRLPQIVRSDNNSLALEPFAFFESALDWCSCHDFVYVAGFTTGGLLSIFTIAPLRMVRITE